MAAHSSLPLPWQMAELRLGLLFRCLRTCHLPLKKQKEWEKRWKEAWSITPSSIISVLCFYGTQTIMPVCQHIYDI